MIEKVANGAIPRAAGINALKRLFLMNDADAEAAMATAGTTFVPANPDAPATAAK